MALCMALHVYCQHGLFPFASKKGTTHSAAKVLQISEKYKKCLFFFTVVINDTTLASRHEV